MSIEKNMNTRIQHKHDIEVNWEKAINFIPKKGELIVYDPDENYNYSRVKIGDEISTANELPFIIAVDTSLTQSGKAADAKAVGDKIAEITGISLVEPAEDDIPKVFFGGALQQTKDEKVVPFRYISKTDDFSGYAEIKAQGNSSMSYPKKNQTVKMFKDADCTEKLKVDFKGWGKQNKHVYKANWIDITHARNVVSARLWGDVVKSRANYAELPELLRTSPNQGAIDGFPVKVYAAGVYQGRYSLNIPKDKWMANMDDGLDTHCILCGKGYISGSFREASTAQWTDEVHDTMPTSIKNRWIEVINFVMNSTDEEFVSGLGAYFDIPSLIDYYLFGLVSCGLDAFGKNQLYMTYDGQRWIASMYDMDSTWGLWWDGTKFVPATYARNEYQDYKSTTGGSNILYDRIETLFVDEIRARYHELRYSVLSYEWIVNKFEQFTDICHRDLVDEDYANTTGEGQFTAIPSKTTNNIQQIRQFVRDRLIYTDGYIGSLGNYTVTYNLTNCSSTNTIRYSVSGDAYETTISPDENYEIDSVTVTMGGVDITSSCYLNGVINIPSVTGDVIITATAKVGQNAALVYSLETETALTGSNYIDTGIALFDKDKDFTVIIDYEGSADNVSGTSYTLAEIRDTLFSIRAKSGSGIFKFIVHGYTINNITASSTSPVRNVMVITKEAETKVFTLYSTVDGGVNTPFVTPEQTFARLSETLILGAAKTTDNAFTNFMHGKIYGCKIYERVLTTSEIADALA